MHVLSRHSRPAQQLLIGVELQVCASRRRAWQTGVASALQSAYRLQTRVTLTGPSMKVPHWAPTGA